MCDNNNNTQTKVIEGSVDETISREFNKAMQDFKSMTKRLLSFQVLQDNTCFHNTTNNIEEIKESGPSSACSHALTKECDQHDSGDNMNIIHQTDDLSTSFNKDTKNELISDNNKRKITSIEPNNNIKRCRLSSNTLTQLPSISFEGFASDDSMIGSRFYRLMLFEADCVIQCLQEFESCFENLNLNLEQNWYPLLKSCFKNKGGKMYTWFEKCVDKSLSWIKVKQLIIKEYGYLNPKVKNAVLYFINHFQSIEENQDFKVYYETYCRAVRGLPFIHENINPSYKNHNYLIRNFIIGVYYKNISNTIYILLRELYLCKKDSLLESEHFTIAKKYTNVPSSWEEFEDIINKGMDFLLMCENDCKQVEEELRQKEIKKSELLTNDKLLRKQAHKLIKEIIKQDSSLTRVFKKRKENGMCIFCNIERYSSFHILECKVGKKLMEEK